MRILGIDPGTDKMGLTLIELDDEGYRMRIEMCETHAASRMLHRRPQTVLDYGELTARLACHYDNLSKQIQWYQPDIIVAESPFFNPRRPSSAEPLARLKQVLTEVSVDHHLELVWIAPQQMKRIIGAKMKGDAKNNIREAVQQLLDGDQLFFGRESGHCDLTQLDEHSVDSIGVAYSYALEFYLGAL